MHAIGTRYPPCKNRLLWSMRPPYFDENDRQLLLATCFADRNGSPRETITRQIERFEAMFSQRHTADRYYRATATEFY